MINQTIFGTANGETAYKFILENHKGTKIGVSNFGALVLSIIVKGKDGVDRDIVLGFDNPEGYLQRITDIGAYVGRNANRIKDASVCIEGTTYKLDANDGKNNLHSGFTRSHRVFYDFKIGEDTKGQFVELYRVSPHLEQGFPGNLEQIIRYTLTDEKKFPSSLLEAGKKFVSKTVYQFDV